MERRKFIIGAGAIAAGSAAAVGTGAFTSVDAQRDVTVNVADDADALLAMERTDHPNSAYAVKNDDGTIGINVSDDGNWNHDNDDAEYSFAGDGVNKEAYTNILHIFVLTNQGTQPVQIDVTGIGHDIGSGPNFPGVDMVATENASDTIPDGGTDDSSSLSDGNSQPVLEPGESIDVGLWISTHVDDWDGDYDVTIHADADY
jgi:hypothetical protein